jgi:SDR family mycofactocin-dependent oxidoreductase
LEGKIAFITGGARGQGRAIAAKFAAEGADIAICDICEGIDSVPYPLASEDDLRDTARLIENAGRRCLTGVVDVRDGDALAEFVARVEDELGPIEVVCANAGVFSHALLDDMSKAMWDDMIAVNLTGVFNTVKAVAPAMSSRARGSIILTSSVNGREGMTEMPHYVAAKHGVVGLTKSFAYELGPKGIRVNTIMPGPVFTALQNNPDSRKWIVSEDEDPGPDRIIEATRAWHALRGRPSLPASAIADAVIWLASDESQHVTGIELPIDAGHSILPGMNMDPITDPGIGPFDYDGNALTETR